LEVNGDMVRVRFVEFDGIDEEWFDLHNIKMRSRRCDDFDCGLITKRIDVVVRAPHPHSQVVNPPRPLAYYDAQVVRVNKHKHKPDCRCTYLVQFYEIQPGRVRHEANRELCTGVPFEVQIDALAIPQLLDPFCLERILQANMDGVVNLRMTWLKDAYSLKETFLDGLLN